MKKPFLIVAIVLLGLCGSIYLDSPAKQEPTNTGIKMLPTSGPTGQAVYWIGQDGNGYLKSAATGWSPTQIGAGDLPNAAKFATQIADPNVQSGGGGSGGSAPSAGGATSAVDPNMVSQYDQGIGNTQAAIDRLPGQRDSANSNINSSYQDALNQLLGGENQAHATYDTNKHQTALDYVSGKNTVRSNAGSSLNGLLRLLGSRGAGGGSAATISAPGAVARQATIQQGDLGNTFGQNNQSLDTNWNTFETGVNNQRASADKQRQDQLAQNSDQFNSNQASLLQQLAQLSGQKAAYTGGNATAAAQPYLDQANGLLNSVGTFHYSPINYNTQAYTAPDLAKYLVAPNNAPKFNGQTQGNDFTSPYLQALLGKKQQPVGA